MSRWYYPLRIAILFLVGLAIYYQTFAFGFVFDDNAFIVNNPYIRNFHDIHYMWITYPVTRLIGIYSFALNYSIGQLNPTGYHIFNFSIHLLTTGLVWALSRTLFKITGWLSADVKLREELAFIIALLFLVHPGHTQAVTYISQRFESMAALFYFASLLCYLQARISSVNTHKIFLFAGTALLALLGILTKETAATIPATILAIELIVLTRNSSNAPKNSSNIHRHSRASGNPEWKLLLPITILSILFIIFFMKIVRTNFDVYLNFTSHSSSHDGDLITGSKYVLTQMRVFLTFLRLLILPINQNLDYDYSLSTSLLNPPLTLVGLGFIGLFIFLILKLRQRWPLISFGLAWILITFSINTAPRINVIFEHKLYLISYGFFLAIVCFLATMIKDRKILFSLLIIIVAALSLVSYKRNQVWKDNFTLWNDVVSKSPHKARGFANLGNEYYNQGNFTQAESDFNKAIEISPRYVEAYGYLGLIHEKQGNYAQAIFDFSKAIEINPQYEKALRNRGESYWAMGNLNQAIADYNAAISLNPDYANAYISRAIAFYQLKKYSNAWADVHKAEELKAVVNPGFINALTEASGQNG